MRRLRKLILPTLLLFCTLNVNAQFKDSIDLDLPVLDYSNPKRYLLKDVKITGVKYIAPQLIINTAGLAVGDSVYLPSDYISNAIQTLWGQRYYSDIKAVVDIEGEDAFLELILTERPRVSVWNITGVSKSERTELDERLKFRSRNEYSEYALNNSKDIIHNFFAEKGFMYPEIKISQINDTLLDNYVIVTFNVDKKKKVKIKEIFIEGGVNIPEKKLKQAMKKTREKSLINLFKTAKFSKDEFEISKQELTNYMHSQGYRDGAVISDSMYVISEKRVGLNIKVNEGQKYYYRNISWVGNTVYETAVLERILGIQKGDTYDKETMESRLGIDGMSAMEGALTVSSLYSNKGYLYYSIEPVETVVEGDSIDIEMRMSEGKPFTVNDVTISGNTRTHDRVVRRELYMRPGELYDQSMLIASMRQIGAMKHFDQEKISPDIQPISDELVDIHFQLEETSSDQFEFSGGWGGGMFVVSAGITFNNVSLRRALDKDAWRPYPAGDNQQVRLSVQSNGAYYQAFSFNFLEPWLGGKKPNSLSFSAYYSAENGDMMYSYGQNIDDIPKSERRRFETVGVALGLGKRLSWPDPYFTLMGELSYQAYFLQNWSNFLINNGQTNTITLTGTVSRNSTDQVIYPRKGSEMYFKLALTPPWSLMNKSKDWSDPNLSDNDRYKWIEYYKINAMARFFVPMLKNEKLVLMTRAEFGYLGNYNENNPSPFEGFTMGGDGVSGYSLFGIQDIGLRGYDEGSLTPEAQSGVQARVYSKWTVELRYPIVLQPSSTVYVLGFAEAGNAAMDLKSYKPFELKRSVGIGLRLNLPMVGMFGIDYGWGLDRVKGSSEPAGGQFHFSMGQTF